MGTVSAASEIYVNTTGNDSGSGTAENPYLTIQKGVDAIDPNGVIYIANGQYSGVNNTNITINKNMTITGQSQAGTTINGTGNNWIFHITSGVNVTIQNLTVTNGTYCGIPEWDGGPIMNLGNLTVTNCTFIDNHGERGGVIFNYCKVGSNSCTVTNSTFTNNHATWFAGAIANYAQGGSIDCTVTNSTFMDNTAISGGAIVNFQTQGSVISTVITTSKFINNIAVEDGGAIANRLGGPISFNVTYSLFVGNTAPIGSAISNDGFAYVENNWWGSNDPVFDNLLSGVAPPTNWLYLTVNATPSTVDNGATSQIIASFNNRYNGTTVIPFEPIGINHIPDVPVQLDIYSWGSFPGNLQTIILDTVNGATTPITYYANGGQPTPTSVIINGTTDGYTTNGTASATLTINKVMNLTVTKTGPEIVIAGNQITYTITVENTGLDSAENVVIIDNISPILESVTHDDFNLGTIAVGTSKTVHINGTVPSSTIKGTIIDNNATVTSTTSGIITPSIIVSTIVDTLADVDLNKTVNNTRPNVGNSVTFIVTAHNYGPSDATNIQIQDIMPAEFSNVNITPSKGTYNNETGIWSLNLKSGEEAILNLTGTVTAIMAGKNTTNTATLIGTTNQTNATIYVPKSDLYIQITSNKNNPTVGETFTLTYKLGNNGPDDAENVAITIPIPEGFHISEIKGDGNWNIVGNNIIWTFDNVTVGDPYLYITGWTTGPGIYLFTASIASDTFIINSRGVSSLSLNSVPQANAATTNTIGMQTTGIPLAGIVLAILMVLGGFISTHKKQ